MAKVALDVVLKDGEDSTAFGNSFSSNADVEVKNPMVAIPSLITMKVEESYIDTFKSDSRIKAVDRADVECCPAGVVPGFTSVGPKKIVTSSTDVSISNNGSDYMPLQMYLDQDNMDGPTLASKTYSYYLGVYTGFPNNPGVWTMYNGDDITGELATPALAQTNKTIRVYEGMTVKLYPHHNAHYGLITSVSGAYQMEYQDRNNLLVDGQNQTNNPTFNIEVGDSVNFLNYVDTTGHPFYIKTTNSTGTGDQVTTGTTYGQGSEGPAYTLSVGWDTGVGTTVSPGTYYYQCGNHALMGGQIIVHAAGSLHNHPLYLKTAASTGTGDQVSGATNQGTLIYNNPLEYTFPEGSAGTYYYQCGNHAAMSGQIIVTSGGTSVKAGKNATDFATSIPDRTYSSRWTGKFVDIVTCETGDDFRPAGDHQNHADFDDLDNPGTSRIIPKDWVDLEAARNNQVSTNVVNTNHGMGVLSVAGGTICGYAKKSKLYQTTTGDGDDTVENINAIVAWHNSKTGNPNNNNLVDPTIMVGEIQWLRGRRIAFPIESVGKIKSPSGDVTRPGPGWGTDFSEFVNRDIIPFQVKDPDTSTWVWCVVLPDNSAYSSLNTAIDAAWDAGVVMILAAGNDGGTYVKTSDARYINEYLEIDANSVKYTNTVDYSNWTVDWTKSTTSGSTGGHPPWRNYGFHGRDKAIDVAAGRNSESWPGLDLYTNRGPGIDIIGRGATTWSSYPGTTYADGKKWSWFSGTSCATPTVVGKAACIMEEYMTYNNEWPTPDQVKELLLSQADENNFQESWDTMRRGLHPSNAKMVKSAGGFDWTSVPAANSHISQTTSHGWGNLNKIQNGTGMNGSVGYLDLASTTRRFSSYNTKGFNRSQTRGPRPKSGGVYPRPRIQRHKILPEFS